MADAGNRHEAAKAALWSAIEDRSDELIATIAALVRIPSLLGDEAPVQEWVASHMRGSGLETAVWELDDKVLDMPNAGRSGVPFAGRPNVTGKRRGAGGGRSLILNGTSMSSVRIRWRRGRTIHGARRSWERRCTAGVPTT